MDELGCLSVKWSVAVCDVYQQRERSQRANGEHGKPHGHFLFVHRLKCTKHKAVKMYHLNLCECNLDSATYFHLVFHADDFNLLVSFPHGRRIHPIGK